MVHVGMSLLRGPGSKSQPETNVIPPRQRAPVTVPAQRLEKFEEPSRNESARSFSPPGRRAGQVRPEISICPWPEGPGAGEVTSAFYERRRLSLPLAVDETGRATIQARWNRTRRMGRIGCPLLPGPFAISPAKRVEVPGRRDARTSRVPPRRRCFCASRPGARNRSPSGRPGELICPCGCGMTVAAAPCGVRRGETRVAALSEEKTPESSRQWNASSERRSSALAQARLGLVGMDHALRPSRDRRGLRWCACAAGATMSRRIPQRVVAIDPASRRSAAPEATDERVS